MNFSVKSSGLILAILILAAALRLPALQMRPMHTDEAVHGIKFAKLLEQNEYRYDPHQYHGPALNYFTLISAWLTGAEDITEVSETTLRIVPVFFGLLMVPLVFLIKDGLGKTAAALAAVILAVSPAMTFYSRYYIQEILLVFFLFGLIVCGYRYLRSPKLIWALFGGLCVGLAHATKETMIIPLASMAAALLLTANLKRRPDTPPSPPQNRPQPAVKPRHILTALLAALAVSALFHSSFLTNPHGIIDSFATYTNYFTRAGEDNIHFHPPWYYLKILAFFNLDNGPIWSEAVILVLAAVAVILAFAKKSLLGGNIAFIKFLCFYTAIQTFIYSMIPYKTPWCMLGFLHGMILLAGVGAAALLNLTRKTLPRSVIAVILAAALAQLAFQAYRANFVYYADYRNPYVYAHPVKDVFRIVDRIKSIAAVHRQGKNMYIEVIVPQNDYWPLPWYLRDFSNVGFFHQVDPALPPAPIIINSPRVESAVTKQMYEFSEPGQVELYVPMFGQTVYLRAGKPLHCYVQHSLWQKYKEKQIPKSQSGEENGPTNR